VTRSLLIANPAAARTARVSIDLVANTLRKGGWEVEVLATTGPGHAKELAEYGVASKVDIVAVFGGDGTTMQAAAALVGTEVPLGIIPEGPEIFSPVISAYHHPRLEPPGRCSAPGPIRWIWAAWNVLADTNTSPWPAEPATTPA